MRLPVSSRHRQGRPGKVLVLFVLLLPVLLGILGVTLDGGLLMAAYRQTENAADAGATAAATDLLRGKTTAVATTTATTFVQTYNGLPNATVTVHIPPSTGPYSGNSHYAEVLVSYPVSTMFIQVLGVNQTQTVQARAVAGFEAVSAGEGVAVLDPTAIPGLKVSGGGTLRVKGRVIVNSQGSGVDETGNTVDLGYQTYAAATGNGSTLIASDIEVVGGVDTPANYQNLPGNTGSPLHARGLPEPDPLLTLPTPTTANGVVNTNWKLNNNGTWTTASQPQDVSVSISGGQSVTFSPGIYSSIKITGGGPGTVTFQPGIYVLSPTKNTSNTLDITSGATITGTGVMFYNTGSDYNPTSGAPDSSDGDTLGTPPNNTYLGGVNISGQNVNLSPISDVNSPFNGMLIDQRRWNTNSISIQGNSSQTVLAGTLYAKWAQFSLSGSGTYNAQFVAGSISVSGGANVTIDYAGGNLGKANQVYLVE